MPEHVVLVAVVVEATDQKEAQDRLMERLIPLLHSRDHTSPIDSWWIAEDERYDGSDTDSAVFVKPGHQREAVALLQEAGHAFA